MQIPLTEAAFMRQVTDLATRLGWQWLHVRPMGNSQGVWRTPTFGPLGKGWPDLVLIRRSTIVYAELKAQTGRLSQEQAEVLAALLQCGPHVYTWRPSDFPKILEVLSNA